MNHVRAMLFQLMHRMADAPGIRLAALSANTHSHLCRISVYTMQMHICEYVRCFSSLSLVFEPIPGHQIKLNVTLLRTCPLLSGL